MIPAPLLDPNLVDELRDLAKQRLRANPALLPHAAVEARWIVDHAMRIATNGEDARRHCQAMVTRRLAGDALSRIFGEAEFYGLTLGVNDETLDPRNDTEALVDLVLDAWAGDTTLRVLELGTGTGCIPIALLHHRPGWTALAVDLAPGAAVMARRNAARHTLSARLQVRQSDWFSQVDSSVDGPFDLVLSNPPYLTQTEMDQLDATVQGIDPNLALFGGPDGLDPYRHILANAGAFLNAKGHVGLEIGWQQRDDVVAIANKHHFTLVQERQDLGKRDRALLFQQTI